MINIKKIQEKHFFQPNWHSIIINPYFIARHGLLNKIKLFANQNFSEKNILDIGCGIKPYRNLFSKTAIYTGIDIKGGGHYDQAKTVDQFYDGINIPFEENKFDAIICTQVLEHANDPDTLLKEINRVLKKDGQLFLTMPFVWNEHEIPFDFRRFTRYGHEKIFEKNNLKIEKIETTSGIFGVCGQLISAFIFESLGKKNKFLKVFISVILCFPIQLIFVVFDCIFKNSWITLDYAINAKKYDL